MSELDSLWQRLLPPPPAPKQQGKEFLRQQIEQREMDALKARVNQMSYQLNELFGLLLRYRTGSPPSIQEIQKAMRP